MFILFFLPFFSLNIALSSTDVCQRIESYNVDMLNKTTRRIGDWTENRRIRN